MVYIIFPCAEFQHILKIFSEIAVHITYFSHWSFDAYHFSACLLTDIYQICMITGKKDNFFFKVNALLCLQFKLVETSFHQCSNCHNEVYRHQYISETVILYWHYWNLSLCHINQYVIQKAMVPLPFNILNIKIAKDDSFIHHPASHTASCIQQDTSHTPLPVFSKLYHTNQNE